MAEASDPQSRRLALLPSNTGGGITDKLRFGRSPPDPDRLRSRRSDRQCRGGRFQRHWPLVWHEAAAVCAHWLKLVKQLARHSPRFGSIPNRRARHSAAHESRVGAQPAALTQVAHWAGTGCARDGDANEARSKTKPRYFMNIFQPGISKTRAMHARLGEGPAPDTGRPSPMNDVSARPEVAEAICSSGSTVHPT